MTTIDEGSFWSNVRRFAGKVPFLRDAVAMYHCMLDSRTPLVARFAAGTALAYFALPLDAVPDFIPGVGMADDAGAVVVALTTVAPYMCEEHYRKADAFFAGGSSGGGPSGPMT